MSTCDDHRCDLCERCRAGECCGADVAEGNLPGEGEWPSPLFAPIGELVEKGGKVSCHLCGEWHVLLAQHVRHAHRLTADAYRSIAGLKCSRSLLPACEIARRSAAAKALGLGLGMVAPSFTTEQRSILAYRRESRAEVRATRKRQMTPEFQSSAARARWDRPTTDDPIAVARRHRKPE